MRTVMVLAAMLAADKCEVPKAPPPTPATVHTSWTNVDGVYVRTMVIDGRNCILVRDSHSAGLGLGVSCDWTPVQPEMVR